MGEYGDLEDNEPEYVTEGRVWGSTWANTRYKQMTLTGTTLNGVKWGGVPLVEVIDLFCGGGGFTQGAINAGASVVLAVDCWQPALDVHIANHPKVPCLNATLGGPIEEAAQFIRIHLTPGSHFHLHGSPPCQNISNASNGDPEEGMVLVNWFIDLVEYMKPDSWSMENVVPVAKKIDKHRPGTPYIKLNSADFGVPQTRNRIFAGEGWVAEESHAKDEWVSVLDALPHLESELESRKGVHKLEALGANQKRYQDRSITEPSKTICGSGNQVGARIFEHTTNVSGSGPSVSRRALSGDRSINKPMKTLCNNRPTLRTVDNEPKAVKIRSLTLAETAVLQGFNVDMKLPYKLKKDAWTILGNAVCPPVAEAIIRGIV